MSRKQRYLETLSKVSKWFEGPLGIPFALLIIAIASYGLLINRLGYYWDDFPLTYIKNVFGSAGLERYFSTNRPFWGLLFQITFSIFKQPWQWQLNSLFWRWLSAVILWLVVREIWPNRKNIAIWVSMLFLVYPGFKQQHVAVIYSNLFIVLDCFLLSLLLNIKALRQSVELKSSRKSWLWQTVALLLSLYNLLAMEYFFTLELIRPILLWNALRGDNFSRRKRFSSALMNWLPYLTLWLGVIIWRAFFFSFQTQNYQLEFLQNIKTSPVQAIGTLFADIGSSLSVVIVGAWSQIFKLPDVSQIGLRTAIVTILLILIITGLLVFFLLRNHDRIHERNIYLSVILLGIIALLLAGVPSWMIRVAPSMGFPGNRFTLPFIIGVSLLLTGLLGFLPFRPWMRAVLLSVMIGFAVGSQFIVVNQFRRDWETQRRFFWQLAWRVPGLEHGTTLMVNKLPTLYYSDNSLTAPLNWFWAPQNNSQQMSYLLLYPVQRLGMSLASLSPDTPISVDYLAAEFNGNTSQVVSVFYEPPACLRVLDRALDSDNRMLPLEMQAAAALSLNKWIHPAQVNSDEILPKNLYTPEPDHGWCYYFETADLARQQENWEQVASLGDEAYKLNDYPNDPSEHFLFIEGYAHVGNWARASELSEQSLSVTPLMEPLLCRLWQRIEAATAESKEKYSAVTTIYTQFNCSP